MSTALKRLTPKRVYCLVCNEGMERKRASRLYCSVKCRKKASRTKERGEDLHQALEGILQRAFLSVHHITPKADQEKLQKVFDGTSARAHSALDELLQRGATHQALTLEEALEFFEVSPGATLAETLATVEKRYELHAFEYSKERYPSPKWDEFRAKLHQAVIAARKFLL